MHESYEASVYFRGATPWWGAELDNSKSKLGELNKRTELATPGMFTFCYKIRFHQLIKDEKQSSFC